MMKHLSALYRRVSMAIWLRLLRFGVGGRGQRVILWNVDRESAVAFIHALHMAQRMLDQWHQEHIGVQADMESGERAREVRGEEWSL